jgi:hypothetical protein
MPQEGTAVHTDNVKERNGIKTDITIIECDYMN